MEASSLVGAWRLVRCEIHFSDGRPSAQPYGDEARGLIVYGDDGWMSATLSRGDRPALSSGGLEFAHHAPDAARAEAFDSYLAYSGRWHLSGDEIVHEVHLALVPDVVGHEQRRRVTWDGDELVLAYSLTSRSGVERTYELRWRRAERTGGHRV